MQRLFIIGNGFDLAHGLPTSYEDFHKFLQGKYPAADTEWPNVPQGGVGHHGEILYDDDEVAGYWMGVFSRIEGETWNELESSLGKLDFDLDLDTLPELYDREGDRDMWKEMANNEDLMSEIVGTVSYIPKWFSEWIDTITLDSSKMKPLVVQQFHDLIHPREDLFLSFNYTQVLERIYNIPPNNICHIHGVQGEELIFGHGAGPLFEEDYTGPYPGSEYGKEDIHNMLRKDTEAALLKHREFFERLSAGFDSIYSYGFSFGEADYAYLREICARVDTSRLTWYLHDYDKDKHASYKEMLVKCGFHGRFGCFSA